MPADTPFAICRTTDLGEAGAFFTADVVETPVLVVRDRHGTIRAFRNLCQHRGVRLVYAKRGVTRTFTCVLHGWTYDAEGQMGGAVVARLATDNPMLRALRDGSALPLLPSAHRHGFVWVTPDPRAALDVAAFLGPVDAALEARGVEGFVVRSRTEAQITDDLAVAVRPHVAAGDALHVLSEDHALVLHARDVSVFTLVRRRAETDFGEESELAFETRSLEHVLLSPPT